MIKGQNTRRQFAGFSSQQEQNAPAYVEAIRLGTPESFIGNKNADTNQREHKHLLGDRKLNADNERVDNNLKHRYSVSRHEDCPRPADVVACPLKDQSVCQVYGTECQYKNRYNCRDYQDYARRRK